MNNIIKCPKCGTIFNIDENDYDAIVRQVRDNLFEEQIKEKEKLISIQKEVEIKKVLDEQKTTYEKLLKDKDNSINNLKMETNKLTLDLDQKEEKAKLNLENALSKKEKELYEQINDLNQRINTFESEKKLAIIETETKLNKEINDLKSELTINKEKAELNEKNIKSDFENKIKVKDEEIAYYKDLKSKMSTKMVGESLEQHCQISYNTTIRPLLPESYFEKDNDISTGSKGDFIFRDSVDGIEYISIMFEMKNEMDSTSKKHKNEDFLKELAKDRDEKNCEYAVLVSLLESDSDLYNQGIVDVSYKYPKMYVIRPQFFIPIITLLVNASKNSIKYKKELAIERNQNLDISNFEKNIEIFKESFGRNYRLASEYFTKAIDEIDKSIDHLLKIKDSLRKSENNLRLANNKASDLTIKALTYNSPSVAQMFNDLKNEDTKEE